MKSKLLRYYEYLYYKLYSWHVLLHKGKYGPERATWYLISFLCYLNFLTILLLLQIFTGYGFIELCDSNVNCLMFGVVFVVLNYFIFIYKNKYKIINLEFSQQNKRQNFVGTVFVWIYMIGSFGVDVILALISKNFNH